MGSDPHPHTAACVPRIVADFDYAGFNWLVVDWPDEDGEDGEWQVYRADLPYTWRDAPHEDLR